MTGSPEPQLNSKQKFPRLVYLSAFFWELVSTNYIVMEKYPNYETPQVEIIEVEVEKGFAASGDGEGNMPGGGDGWN